MPEHGIADDASTAPGEAGGRLARVPAVHLRPAARPTAPSACRSRATPRCARTGRRGPTARVVDFLAFARTEGRFAPHFAADGARARRSSRRRPTGSPTGARSRSWPGCADATARGFVTCGPPATCRPALISTCAYVDARAMDDITILQADGPQDPRQPAAAGDPPRARRTARRRSAGWPSAIGASQPNVSQHLAIMRTAGLVEAERDGREVRYRLADPDVMRRLRDHARRPRATPGPPRRDGRPQRRPRPGMPDLVEVA